MCVAVSACQPALLQSYMRQLCFLFNERRRQSLCDSEILLRVVTLVQCCCTEIITSMPKRRGLSLLKFFVITGSFQKQSDMRRLSVALPLIFSSTSHLQLYLSPSAQD